jgi:hypothetical protein
MNTEHSSLDRVRLRAQIESGETITAIRSVMEQTGLSLRDAHEFVRHEALTAGIALARGDANVEPAQQPVITGVSFNGNDFSEIRYTDLSDSHRVTLESRDEWAHVTKACREHLDSYRRLNEQATTQIPTVAKRRRGDIVGKQEKHGRIIAVKILVTLLFTGIQIALLIYAMSADLLAWRGRSVAWPLGLITILMLSKLCFGFPK